MAQVKVEDGLLEGESVIDALAGTYYSFKGIPYAEPPIGHLRFQAPQPVKPWTGVRSAKEYGPICYQFDTFVTKQLLGQEDCLYLNVYTPDLTPKQPLSVMVWIHGGGFVCGSGNDELYGPQFLIKNQVVLVTLNYRIEALGFLCLHTKDIPGNAGMKDQVAALRWVQRNIQHFGGDPNNVTIFGESAGAASVSYHLVSPMSKLLFKRAIAQSGSNINWWSKINHPRERALILAKKLGCYSEDDKVLTNFFKSIPAETLVNLQLPLTIHESFREYVAVYFAIVAEKEFDNNERFYYEDNSNQWLKIHEGIEVVVGYTEHEGILGIDSRYNLETMFNQANFYPEFLIPNDIAQKATTIEKLKIGNLVKDFYFEKQVISMNNIEKLIKFISSDMFVYGIITYARLMSYNKNKVYLYKFNCKSKRNIFSTLYGRKNILNGAVVAHADDLGYLFPLKVALREIELDSKEYRMVETITKLWTNFAKYGEPTPDNSLEVKWEPFDVEKQNFVKLNEKVELDSYPEKEEIIFWDNIYRKYYPHYFNNKFVID